MIIATGARSHKPNIPGIDQTGVYTFRNLKDAEALYARTSRARHIVVIGGGLLGLESARALARLNTKITLIQQGPRLMNRQLDEESAAKLESIINRYDITVITHSGVRKILGKGRVTGVVTQDQVHIECDTVLLCAGIRPNIEIARFAGINTSQGILVDDFLQTSVKDVFALGECCEHRGATYGLVNPGYEQAAVLANNFTHGQSRYVGSYQVSRLKVVGKSIFSMGSVSDFPKNPFLNQYVYRDSVNEQYRKIVLKRGRLIGAISVGEWVESRRIQEAYQSNRRIWPWHVANFLINGRVFFKANDDVNLWPKETIVCQCNSISQGVIVNAIDSGKDTVSSLQECTGAGTVCGSCKPLLSELIGFTGEKETEKAWIVSLIVCFIAILIAVIVLFQPSMQVSDSVLDISLFEQIWNDKFWKQVTGFTLFGLSVLGLLMSLRKRIVSNRLGDYAYWRVLHMVLGVMCVLILILHTGFSLGSNLNQLLIIDFLSIIILGSLTGVIISMSHKLSTGGERIVRKVWSWAHILFTWPLPLLLSFHILSVYYF